MNTPEATTQIKIYHFEHLQSLTSALVNTWIKKHLKENFFYENRDQSFWWLTFLFLYILKKEICYLIKKSYL